MRFKALFKNLGLSFLGHLENWRKCVRMMEISASPDVFQCDYNFETAVSVEPVSTTQDAKKRRRQLANP